MANGLVEPVVLLLLAEGCEDSGKGGTKDTDKTSPWVAIHNDARRLLVESRTSHIRAVESSEPLNKRLSAEEKSKHSTDP
jgi:hypothetical protein